MTQRSILVMVWYGFGSGATSQQSGVGEVSEAETERTRRGPLRWSRDGSRTKSSAKIFLFIFLDACHFFSRHSRPSHIYSSCS
ncbi:hypothetical protein B0H15DRAFT_833723 [Mycena belliarum]|uniref:Uncharacterized protein n=1 Tax=Mycena belliarum TaxID=1033014 RepID=A0AAD6UB77_9AGAR|nr:hypothetical protein B0H15DRAFT_833723 [Mycena belliae]